ncbi:group III truncated hemoglobin [Microvirga sp. KLBC 81]|uniref:group III truncated hemoglobin n=1 Tax=Microvirga sp. KLBC 81 TaxID=1862707 RepID=UPI00197BA9ED|nr:group III truncated hemoglobin [Microvirga sp. KLBC 81]
MFNDAIHDWAEHLDRLEDFWSSVMLASGRYKGNPVVIHLIHAHRITPSMFSRWLELWEQTTGELLPDEVARTAQAKARRIAKSLQVAIRLRTPGENLLTNSTTKEMNDATTVKPANNRDCESDSAGPCGAWDDSH